MDVLGDGAARCPAAVRFRAKSWWPRPVRFRPTSLLPFEPLHQLLDPLRQGVAEVVEVVSEALHFGFHRRVVGLETGYAFTDLRILNDVLPKRSSKGGHDQNEHADDAPEGFLGHI
jgi:hypothetical protein